MKIVNVHEAKTHLSRLLDEAHAGEEIVIAKNGKPFARLSPLAPQPPRQPGLLKGNLEDDLFAPLPYEELAAWEN
jgi:prevent-host-death family protein